MFLRVVLLYTKDACPLSSCTLQRPNLISPLYEAATLSSVRTALVCSADLPSSLCMQSKGDLRDDESTAKIMLQLVQSSGRLLRHVEGEQPNLQRVTGGRGVHGRLYMSFQSYYPREDSLG